MSEGMPGVCRFFAQFKSNKGYDGRSYIREIVESVGSNGYAWRKCSYNQFSREKQKIAYYARNAAQNAVCGAHFRSAYIFAVFDKAAH